MNQPIHTHGDVAILGGGFAGCAAAWRLANAGLKPVLIEFKWHLGGRATSYNLKNWPAPLDNGQHVLLGCCRQTQRFLKEIAAEDAIDWQETIPVTNGSGGRIRNLRIWPLFAPFHVLPFLAGYPGLTMTDRARIVWGIFGLVKNAKDAGSWGETARRLGQTEDIQKKFWDPFLVSALNADPAKSATSHVRHIVIDAFLRSRSGMRIGIPHAPLVTLFDDRVRPAVERAGAVFQMGKRVLRLSLNPRGFVIHLHDQSALTAKKIIVATGPAAAKMILEESTGVEEMATPIAQFVAGSPIISIHLLYDRVLTHTPFCMVQGKMIQWIFNKGAHNGQQHLQAIISAADAEASQSQMELVISADAEVQSVLGAQANLVQGVAFVEKNATFFPKANLVRPGVRSSQHPDLFLAGDYVETGWPGTIESAVRSGFAAADAVMGVA